MLPQQELPKPRFQWISGGIVLALAVCYWLVWVYKLPTKPGEKPLELHTIAICLGVVLSAAAGWQYLRYRIFKQDVAKGLLVTGSGPPSALWGFVKALFASPTVYTGSRGGQYTVDSKGNKKYKHRS